MGGLSPEDFKKCKQAGLSPEDFKKCKQAGLSPQEFKKCKQAGLNPQEFKKCKQAGLSSHEFKKCETRKSKFKLIAPARATTKFTLSAPARESRKDEHPLSRFKRSISKGKKLAVENIKRMRRASSVDLEMGLESRVGKREGIRKKKKKHHGCCCLW